MKRLLSLYEGMSVERREELLYAIAAASRLKDRYEGFEPAVAAQMIAAEFGFSASQLILVEELMSVTI